ncbi:glycosyltransferase [soil metagenome]
MTAPRRLTLFLDAGLDPRAYERRWHDGLVPDRLPYGTEHVPDGWSFEFACRPVPQRLQRLARLARRVAGFDLVRALVNVRELRQAEAVYCHTEVEYLAVAAALLFRRRRPLVVGQTIWLFHQFDAMNPLRRTVIRRLLSRVDLLVSNARPNFSLGQRISPRGRHRYVPFGVSRIFGSRARQPGQPDILSVGNDVARDWPLFRQTMAAYPDREIRAASKVPMQVGERQVSRVTADVGELLDLYSTARVLVVAVKDNSHASGITTLLEAVAAGTPAVATRAGGLDDYFDDSEVLFVAPGSTDELEAAIEQCLVDPAAAAARALAAQATQAENGYWNDSYWVRIVDAIVEVSVER